MRCEGALSTADAETLAQRLRDSLAQSRNNPVLDLKKLNWDKVQDLRPLREKLAGYRNRIRMVFPLFPSRPPGRTLGPRP